MLSAHIFTLVLVYAARAQKRQIRLHFRSDKRTSRREKPAICNVQPAEMAVWVRYSSYVVFPWGDAPPKAFPGALGGALPDAGPGARPGPPGRALPKTSTGAPVRACPRPSGRASPHSDRRPSPDPSPQPSPRPSPASSPRSSRSPSGHPSRIPQSCPANGAMALLVSVRIRPILTAHGHCIPHVLDAYWKHEKRPGLLVGRSPSFLIRHVPPPWHTAPLASF